MKLPVILVFAMALLTSACTSTDIQTPPPPTASVDSQNITIYLTGNDHFYWDGWDATSQDIPNLVQQYHPQSITIHGASRTVVDYRDAQRVCDALLAAGVKNVQIASGGLTNQ
jgi:biopolymer transport protein ExbD